MKRFAFLFLLFVSCDMTLVDFYNEVEMLISSCSSLEDVLEYIENNPNIPDELKEQLDEYIEGLD